MIDALRDPVWQFVGVVLAALSVAAAFWIYWLQRQIKELAFGLLSSRRPLAIADELSSRVTVELDGKSVGNLHLLVYGLKNSGHRAVAPTDFQSPLRILFTEGQVVSAEIAAQTPTNLGAKLLASEAEVALQPLLLNPGDQVLIQVLLSSARPAYLLDARVLDVSSFAPINAHPRLPPFFASGLPMAMLVYTVVGLGFLLSTDKHAQAYLFLGIAAFLPIFGLSARLLQDIGKSARRRISEV